VRFYPTQKTPPLTQAGQSFTNKKFSIMNTSSPTNGHFAQSVRAAKNDTSARLPVKKGDSAPQTAPDRKKSEPHLRRTTAQVKQKWLLGDYTASGYLVELFASMKAEGFPIVIHNVAQFCQEWGIGERRFYRAKAKLIDQGRLDEEIKGTLIVRLVGENSDHLYDDTTVSLTDKNVSDDDTTVSLTDKNVSDDDTTVSLTPANLNQESRFDDSPDLYSDLDQISNNSLSVPTHHPERELDNFSSEELEEGTEEEFRQWLMRKAHQMPYKPTLIHQWVRKQMEKPENWEEFLKYREAQIERINFPPAPREFAATLADYVYPLAHFSDDEQRQNHLARLRAKWHQPNLQAAAIAEAEKHGFVVTPHGIEEA
jgi:hypothetical protein